MIDYISEKAAIQDQVSSYNTAINEIKKMRSNYEKHMLGDFRGDNEKVLGLQDQTAQSGTPIHFEEGAASKGQLSGRYRVQYLQVIKCFAINLSGSHLGGSDAVKYSSPHHP